MRRPSFKKFTPVVLPVATPLHPAQARLRDIFSNSSRAPQAPKLYVGDKRKIAP